MCFGLTKSGQMQILRRQPPPSLSEGDKRAVQRGQLAQGLRVTSRAGKFWFSALGASRAPSNSSDALSLTKVMAPGSPELAPCIMAACDYKLCAKVQHALCPVRAGAALERSDDDEPTKTAFYIFSCLGHPINVSPFIILDQRQKSKGGSSSCCSRHCCIL